MSSNNTILFLFDQNDLISNSSNELLFVFGSSEDPCSYKNLPIDNSNNIISFDCGCTFIDKDSNTITLDCNNTICIDYTWKEQENPITFDIDCVVKKDDTEDSVDFNINCDCNSEELIPIYLNNVYSYFGISSSSAFSHDISSASYFGYYANLSNIIVPDMRVIATQYFGYESNTNLLVTKYLYATSYVGWNSSSVIIYNPYNEFFETDEYSASYFGYNASSTIIYDPYNILVGEHDSIPFYNGFELKNVFVFNPYNEFFETDSYTSFYSGYELKSSVIFNPYNKFDDEIVYNFGYSTSSSIRYSDDPYINSEINYFGYSSQTELEYANIFYNIESRNYFGYSSDHTFNISPGFITNAYFGYYSQQRFLMLGRQHAIFNNCIATFGYELHNNVDKIRYFDLSNTECCSIKLYPLKHIEMTDRYDVNTIYGLDKGWGFSSIADLQTQPRFSASLYHGFNAKVVDSSVYLGTCYSYVGLHMNTRGLEYFNNIEIGYGNFIIDQNEIKIEMTKPEDTFGNNHYIGIGYTSKVLFGAEYALYPQSEYFGYNAITTLYVEEALRGTFRFGFRSEGALNRRVSLSSKSHHGFISRASFYEAPYIMYFGLSSECGGLITENFVELLEEGELDNDYIFQNENGDPDLDRTTDVSIEGYPYSRYIKGRCY